MLTINELTVSYKGSQLALDRVSVTIEAGKIVGIIGPNGAGKSSFMKAVLGLVPHEGHIERAARESFAYVEQKSQVDDHFPITVKECVSLGIYQKVGLFRRLKRSDWQTVEVALEQVGLSEYKNQSIKNLSGGQFQRMLLARCLIQDAQIIFLDEPFVGVDVLSETMIMRILKGLRDQGRTIIVVHHDLSKVKTYFDTILLLNKKMIAYGSVEQVFTPKNLKKAYGDQIFIGGEE